MATICQLFTHMQTHTQLNEDRNPACIQVCNTEANLTYKQTHTERHNGVKSELNTHTKHTHTRTKTHRHTDTHNLTRHSVLCTSTFLFVIVLLHVGDKSHSENSKTVKKS